MSALTMSLSGDGLVIEDLFRRAERADAAARKVVADYGRYQHDLTFQLSPYDWQELYDTFHMREQIRVELTSDEHLHALEVGWNSDDFTSEGFPFYPPYQEFGTIYMPAQPSLGPAWNELEPHFVDDAEQAVRDTLIEGR